MVFHLIILSLMSKVLIMLLNHIPVLDKGYVALISSMNDSKLLAEIGTEFFGVTQVNPKTMNLAYATLAIKCPIFVQTHLCQYGFTIVTTKPTTEIEAYCPNVGEIGSSDTETNRVIADDIERTTAALLINPRSYQTDGCNRFISHVIMPISTYTTLLVSGTHEQWNKFIQQWGARLPAPIESYRVAVEQIISAEWK